jgi:GT2 family glycosyltransferase
VNKKVASILLNYNSNNDLFLSVKDLLEQDVKEHTLIIVDNNSTKESVKELKEWQKRHFPSAISGSVDEVAKQLALGEDNKVIFVFNNKNAGYSAGNNIGIRIADKLNADAVLIVNPDMRIENVDYIQILLSVAIKDEQAAIVASGIIGVDGKNQSPMVSDDFWREFLWPRQVFPKFFKKVNFIEEIDSNAPVYVAKVMGCCMLIKMNFLKTIEFLDESTFLYSEEAILSSQVERANKKVVFLPSLIANHLHHKENKDNSSKRMLFMIKSRLLYLRKYSQYSMAQKVCLLFSYKVWYLLHFLKKVYIDKTLKVTHAP